jgi:SpoVK/Ycf46/Vps4 family AAA+-type ATPase
MKEYKEYFQNRFIDSIVYPTRYDLIKADKKNSYLLYGPPGCGKTHFIEAFVGELNKQLKEKGKKEFSFINGDLAYICDSYVGEPERKLKNLFKTAEKNEPCVLAFEEFDIVSGYGHRRGRYDLTPAFLYNMYDLKDKQIILIGETNKPDNLDGIFLHSGRFGDNIIFVQPPDYETRKQLFEKFGRHLKSRNMLGVNICFDELAEKTRGFSVADITHVHNTTLAITKERISKTNEMKVVKRKDIIKAINNCGSSLGNWYTYINGKMDNVMINCFPELEASIKEYYPDARTKE